MAIILQKGQTFTIGTDENTIQSFNGGIGGTKGNMYVDVIIVNQTITTTPTEISVTGDNTFTVTVTGASGSSKYEAGDEVQLYKTGDKDASLHNGIISSVSHSSGNVVLEVYITDPHADPHSTTSATVLSSAVTRSTRYVTIAAPTFTPVIPSSVTPLFAGDITSLTVNGGEVSSLSGIQAYEYNGSAFVLTFGDDQRAAAAVTTLQQALDLDGEIDMSYTATTEEFDRLDSEHHIHVGSKTNTTVAVVTPITLPSGLTIRAGQGVGDIFLIKDTES